MIVTRTTFHSVVEHLSQKRRLGLDTETEGLRPYHGDKIFSLILADEEETYYFNFKTYAGLGDSFVLPLSYVSSLRSDLFLDPKKIWFIQNAANFDMCMLKADWGVELAGEIHCTKAIARLEHNDLPSYSLKNLLPRLGLSKDETVEEYVKEHELHTLVKIPGKAQEVKLKHYDQVPFDIIAPYGEKDGSGVYLLGLFQENRIAELDLDRSDTRSLTQVMENEKRLQKTIFRMKDRGVLIDRDYCRRAAEYEAANAKSQAQEFERITGVPFRPSPKLFKSVFKLERWHFTPKGNPSFDADVLEGFRSPAAKCILKIRDAKSKSDFYHGFLYHADRDGVVHPNFDPGGTVHGRFSSSAPNFQNLTSSSDGSEETSAEFSVRGAIVPRPGFILISPDYSQMEYVFAMEMACRVQDKISPLAQSIKDGLDFHEATRKRVKEVTGQDYPRKTMKIANFLTLYGGGVGKLSGALGISTEDARSIRAAIKSAAPEIDSYIGLISRVAEERKYIVNWLGRRCYFPYRSYSYRAANYHISGGCADIVKIAMNRIDEYLLDKKSKLIMTVHDELPIEVHESEIEEVPRKVKEIMESVFISKYVPLLTGMQFSHKSLAHMEKGFP